MTDHWNVQLYDSQHSFVSQYGTELIDLLAPQNGERILDLGCGTGDLANQPHMLGVDVVGIDSSGNMIEQARKSILILNFSKRMRLIFLLRMSLMPCSPTPFFIGLNRRNKRLKAFTKR